MKIVLAAINAKYIHVNLAIYSLRAFSDEYKEQIQIKEYTINQYTEDILADLYNGTGRYGGFFLLYMEHWDMVEELQSSTSVKAGDADMVWRSGSVL